MDRCAAVNSDTKNSKLSKSPRINAEETEAFSARKRTFAKSLGRILPCFGNKRFSGLKEFQHAAVKKRKTEGRTISLTMFIN